MITQENYRSYPAVSNSDLTTLKKMWEPEDVRIDKEKAYKFGNLLDAVITEPHKVDYYNHMVGQVHYDKEDFECVGEMKKVCDKDAFFISLRKQCDFQHISYNPSFQVEYDGFRVALPAKCKWDLFCKNMDLGGDIKSTAATTQKQFEEACWYFDYYRSRAWYMDLENRTNDILIGISKKNYQVFKIPIRKGDKYYTAGKAQYQELAFRYWTYFAESQQRRVTIHDRVGDMKITVHDSF